MILVKLLETQIADLWPVIKSSMKEALPPFTDDSQDAFNNILHSLMINKLQCLAIVENGDDPEIRSLMTVKIVRDEVSGCKTLLIYTFTALQPLTAEDTKVIYKDLKAYAESNNCVRVTVLTDNEKLVSVLEFYGMQQKWKYLTLDL